MDAEIKLAEHKKWAYALPATACRRRVFSQTQQAWYNEYIGSVYRELVDQDGLVERADRTLLTGDYLRDWNRIMERLERLWEPIVEDHTTRQAVLSIWQDCAFYPACYFAFQAMLRGADLELVVFMRSSSAEKWADDLEFFRTVSFEVKDKLLTAGVHVDDIYVTVLKSSDHIYEGSDG